MKDVDRELMQLIWFIALFCLASYAFAIIIYCIVTVNDWLVKLHF